MNFSALSIHMLDIEYHNNIWQVFSQLSFDDTCQIWMWFKVSKRYFCKIENIFYREINEWSFRNPHLHPTPDLDSTRILLSLSTITGIPCSADITQFIISQIFTNTVHYLTNIHKIHPVLCQLGQGVRCLLWIKHLIDILAQLLQLFMQYVTILDRDITALLYVALEAFIEQM